MTTNTPSKRHPVAVEIQLRYICPICKSVNDDWLALNSESTTGLQRRKVAAAVEHSYISRDTVCPDCSCNIELRLR